MDRPNEQGIKFNTGPFIDNATVTLHYAPYAEFEVRAGGWEVEWGSSWVWGESLLPRRCCATG